MNSNLLSYENLQIPQALAMHHEDLRDELIRATTAPRRIGKAAKRLARLCFDHFETEEVNVFRAFGLLHDLASDRVQPDVAAMARMIAQLNAQVQSLRDHHQSIKAAAEELLQEARKEDNRDIANLVEHLRDHEKIEDDVVYPTVLQIAKTVEESLTH